jgi:hypothetical protein
MDFRRSDIVCLRKLTSGFARYLLSAMRIAPKLLTWTIR